ncbi:MAG: hypothetical protein NTY41_15305, partial [Proteobacteria bacterium]|nr:hypothetical protein [Pseudomonadota bacterium]
MAFLDPSATNPGKIAMPEFENYSREAAEIEREIARKGIVLGIDWDDDAQVRALAREALSFQAK